MRRWRAAHSRGRTKSLADVAACPICGEEPVGGGIQAVAGAPVCGATTIHCRHWCRHCAEWIDARRAARTRYAASRAGLSADMKPCRSRTRSFESFALSAPLWRCTRRARNAPSVARPADLGRVSAFSGVRARVLPAPPPWRCAAAVEAERGGCERRSRSRGSRRAALRGANAGWWVSAPFPPPPLVQPTGTLEF